MHVQLIQSANICKTRLQGHKNRRKKQCPRFVTRVFTVSYLWESWSLVCEFLSLISVIGFAFSSLIFAFGFLCQSSITGLPSLVIGFWSSVISFLSLAFGHRSSVFGLWLSVFGHQSLDFDYRSSVFGHWFLVLPLHNL